MSPILAPDSRARDVLFPHTSVLLLGDRRNRCPNFWGPAHEPPSLVTAAQKLSETLPFLSEHCAFITRPTDSSPHHKHFKSDVGQRIQPRQAHTGGSDHKKDTGQGTTRGLRPRCGHHLGSSSQRHPLHRSSLCVPPARSLVFPDSCHRSLRRIPSYPPAKQRFRSGSLGRGSCTEKFGHRLSCKGRMGLKLWG